MRYVTKRCACHSVVSAPLLGQHFAGIFWFEQENKKDTEKSMLQPSRDNRQKGGGRRWWVWGGREGGRGFSWVIGGLAAYFASGT